MRISLVGKSMIAINVDTPGCEMLVVRDRIGSQVGRFSSWGTAEPRGFLEQCAYSEGMIHSTLSYSNWSSSYRLNSRCTKHALRQNIPSEVIRLPSINMFKV